MFLQVCSSYITEIWETFLLAPLVQEYGSNGSLGGKAKCRDVPEASTELHPMLVLHQRAGHGPTP